MITLFYAQHLTVAVRWDRISPAHRQPVAEFCFTLLRGGAQ